MKRTIQVEEEEEFEREIMVPKVISEDREIKVPVPVMETKTVRVPRQRIITEEEEVRCRPHRSPRRRPPPARARHP